MRSRCLIVAVVTTIAAAATPPLHAADLPVPCAGAACGAGVPAFVTDGAATAAQTGNTLNVTQTTGSATLNWQSFNVGAGATVNFAQPDRSSIALNRIYSADASRVQGAINANGRVYLLNQNGVLFADGARVNVSGLVASSLNLTPQAATSGLARAADTGAPALQPFRDARGNAVRGGAVQIDAGAQIDAPGGQVLVFAPEVRNNGRINTPDGQTVLAAGQRIFLVASSDPNLRGLLVEVGDGGTVTNGSDSNAGRAAADLLGRITAERGNVTLAGALVRQNGLISATTTTRSGGSIRLQARDTTSQVLQAPGTLDANRGGELQLGRNSVTAVTLQAQADDATVDANVQPKSTIDLSGRLISIQADALVRANGGRIRAVASSSPQLEVDRYSSIPDSSLLTVDAGAVLDVSGASLSLAMERNVVRAELRGNQLADSPLQRDGPLRGEAVYVDIRQSGTRADGTRWQGTPLADLSGDVSNVRRDVFERNLTGGSVLLQSQGTVIVRPGATIDVSGGHIDWMAGYLRTSQLLGTDGRIYDIGSADRDRNYVGIIDSLNATDQRWGTNSEIVRSGYSAEGRFESGYTEGRDAGAVSLLAPRAVLDGNISGNTTVGAYQRTLAGSAAAATAAAYTLVPRGATLIVGNSVNAALPNYLASNVEIAPGLVQPANAAAVSSTIRIRPELIAPGGVQQLIVFANRNARIAAGAGMNFQPGGTLDVTAATINVDSNVVANSGLISFRARPTVDFTAGTTATTPSVTIAAGVRLDASGRWINDNNLLTGAAPETAALAIDGGRIVLNTTNGGLTTGAQSVLDVSGGARQRSDGSITAGAGGSISLGVSAPTVDRPATFNFASELRGYALSRGGALDVTTNAICIAATNCATSAAELWLTPATLTQGGFERLTLNSNLGSMRVLPGTTLNFVQQNYQLRSGTGTLATGTAASNLYTVATLPEYSRRAMAVTLTSAFTQAQAIRYADLSIGTGATLLTDAGGSFTLRSDSRLFIDGSLRAPGGSISMLLQAGIPIGNDQGIWLGSTSLLDVAGTATLTPNDLSLRAGTLRGGGNVVLEARRGVVVAANGSRIDASGAAAVLDLRDSQGGYTATPTASAGGLISVTAAEGIQLAGSLRAAAGAGATSAVAGGSLVVAIDGSNRNGTRVAGFLGGDRRIVVSATPSLTTQAAGTRQAATDNGLARVASSTVAAGGFDNVTLVARNLFEDDPQTGALNLLGYGVVSIDAGTQLSVPGRLVLNAPVITVNGGGTGTGQFTAGYLALGASDRTNQAVPTARAGTANLQFNGQLIDLLGNLTLDGVASSRFQSAGDIRARGVFSSTAINYIGALASFGNLEFIAQQFYPSTLTRYSITTSNPSGSIRIGAAPGTGGNVLSAAGRLDLSAASIVVDGTLRAPLGQVNLNATNIRVGAAGLISTSTNNATIPFGISQGGLAWTYELDDGVTRVFGDGGEALPAGRITLNGTNLQLDAGSVLDTSGGGDLLAYEFVPGTSGSRDVLSTTVRPTQFAIVPSLSSAYAPIDPREYRGSTLQPGDSIYIAGGAGLPAGNYMLLPARYALLPGAFLVTPAAGYQDITAGQSFAQRAGGVVVAGRYTNAAAAATRDSRYQGFLIRAGSDATTEARYDLTSANRFFATSGQRIPNDAGTVTLAATAALQLNGRLQASVGTGGRGSTLEIASSRLRVSADGDAGVQGFVNVSASQLSRLGAQSILLGGRRTGTTATSPVEVVAADVVVGRGAVLTAPDVILTARDRLSLEAGAQVVGAGSFAGTPNALVLPQGPSLIRVSSTAMAPLTRSGSVAGLGQVDLGAGSILRAAAGSMIIDAGSAARSLGTLDVRGGALLIGAPRIALGNAPTGYAGFALDGALLASLGARSLELRAGSSIDLYRGADLTTTALTLSSPRLVAAEADVNASLRADTLSLRGGSAAAVTAPSTGNGALALSSGTVDFAGGYVDVAGMQSVQLTATGAMTTRADGGLRTSGDLQITANQLTSNAGVDQSITAAGRLRFVTAGAAPSTATAGELGAGWTFTANDITGDVRILAPSGLVEFNAIGPGADVNLGSQSRIDVSGRSVAFDNLALASRGGSVRITSSSGGVVLQPGAVVNVAAAAGGESGSLSIIASEGSVSVGDALRGSSSVAYSGASANIIARLLDFSALRTALVAAGFDGDLSITARGAVDMRVAASESLRANSISLTTDGGAIDIAGSLISAPAQGGNIVLAADRGVRVSGTLDAHGNGVDTRGGNIDIMSRDSVRIVAGARLDVSGGALTDTALPPGGTVLVRLPRSAVLTTLDADASNDALVFAGQVAGARYVTIEGYSIYLPLQGVIGASNTIGFAGNPWFSDARDFRANAPSILAALGLSSQPLFRVLPGIELISAGNLTLAQDWNLFDWRFGGLPGILTLRARGDIRINGSLSDGFSATTGSRAITLPFGGGESWAYRIVAGSNLTSSNALATTEWRASLPQPGSVFVAAGTSGDEGGIGAPIAIRTGTGRIDIAAAGDLVLGNQASVIYSAGRIAPGVRIPDDSSIGGLDNLFYPYDGGNIGIRLARDLLGAPTTQLFTEWLLRSGGPDSTAPSATAWTVSLGRFEQGIATLGGGNVRIAAGRDISNLSASTPSIGRQVASVDPARSVVEQTAGGNLTITAGRDVLGGRFYADRGVGRVAAGGSVTTNPLSAGAQFGPILGIGDASFGVQARRGATIATAVNPLLLPVSTQFAQFENTFFTNYSSRSAVSVASAAGDVSFVTDTSFSSRLYELFPFYPQIASGDLPMRVLPPNVQAAALSGSLRIGGSFSMWPAARGDLKLLARNNLDIQSIGLSSLDIVMSEAALDSTLPTPRQPTSTLDLLSLVLSTGLTGESRFNSATPLHAGDPVPAYLVANNGSITMQTAAGGGNGFIYLPKRARVVAGNDIINLGLRLQHNDAGDVSLIRAGRDFTYPIRRDLIGRIVRSAQQVVVDGPGALQVEAGRDIDLQASRGITTQGNLANRALPAGGADVSLYAGTQPSTVGLDAFITRYVVQGSLYDAAFITYVESVTGTRGFTKAQALARFIAFDQPTRRRFAEAVLFAELRAGGRSAAQPGAGLNDFTRAFAALETYFPGSNPDPALGQTNPYSGNIRLFFSRVYTLAGGNINLLAPGGEVNVGLAAPPVSFGLRKEPSELGLVAQSTGSIQALAYRDFQVNESRAFAADGGNILVWSTRGDIDAGRGAKTAISAPAPVITFDASGQPQITFPAALTGSGIQTLATTRGRQPGDVDLFAPRGVVNASDAGIVAGNLTIAATAVLGANNIQVSGTSVGVPVDTGGLGVSLAGASGAAGSAAASAAAAVSEGNKRAAPSKSPLADAALGWLDVFVEGYGEDVCKPNDIECLRRQRRQ